MDLSAFLAMISPFGGILITGIPILAATLTLLANRSASVRNQRSSVILHCSLRYDALYEARAKIEIPKYDPLPPLEHADPRIQEFFHRYFGLESDQIDFWLAGYVDPETMSSWFVSFLQNLYNRNVAGYDFKQGWLLVKEHHRVVNPTLLGFVDNFLQNEIELKRRSNSDDEIYAHIVRFMETTEWSQRKLRKKLRKVFFSGISARELTSTLPEHLKKRVVELRLNNLPRA